MTVLPQVVRAFNQQVTSGAMIGRNLLGLDVFSSYALIPALNWAVFIERPVNEAYAPLYASIFRTSTLLLVGLGLALLSSLFVGRRIVRPLRTLGEGAARIGAGQGAAGDHVRDLGPAAPGLRCRHRDVQRDLHGGRRGLGSGIRAVLVPATRNER
jgi:methyl-accepting chemotaxis protein